MSTTSIVLVSVAVLWFGSGFVCALRTFWKQEYTNSANPLEKKFREILSLVIVAILFSFMGPFVLGRSFGATSTPGVHEENN